MRGVRSELTVAAGYDVNYQWIMSSGLVKLYKTCSTDLQMRICGLEEMFGAEINLGTVNLQIAIEVWEWMQSLVELGILLRSYLIAIPNLYHTYKKCFYVKI